MPQRFVRLTSRNLTLWIFCGLSIVSALVGTVGLRLLLDKVEQNFIAVQAAGNEQQARRMAGILEQELARGTDSGEVRRRFQESLVTGRYDPAGFICLLGSDAHVLCHPDPKAVGMDMSDVLLVSLQDRRATSFREVAANSGKGFRLHGWLIPNQKSFGARQIVYQRPVPGTDWLLSVHSDGQAITQRVAQLRGTILNAGVPIMLAFVLCGTAVARNIGRKYERRIERTNDELERRVKERTAALNLAMDRYRSLFEAVPSPVFVIGARDKVVDANRAAEKLTEYNRAALIGQNIDALLERANQGEPILHTASNTIRNVVLFRSNVGHDSELALVLLYDVTEQKRLENELRQAQKLEAVGQLAGGIAHDFNNLLLVISGYTDLARRLPPGQPERGQCLGEVAAAVDRARNLTSQLLVFSRKQVLKPQLLNLNEVILEMTKLLRRLIGERVKIVTSLAANLWTVSADKGQFEQVLMNLAINARDAMPEGGTLLISTENRLATGTDSGSCVEISVSDSGSGIPEEIRDRIFEPFFSSKEVGKGTGLGLSIVHGIVKQHGGTISFQSQVGRGTTFVVKVPPVEAQASPTSGEAPAALQRGSETILVVEDDAHVRRLVELALSDRGYAVASANSGEAALEVIRRRSGNVDLVLSDVVMPGMAAKEMSEHLRTDYPRIKIGYMSGYSDETQLPPGTPLLQKPFNAVSLSQFVRQVLGGAVPPGAEKAMFGDGLSENQQACLANPVALGNRGVG